MRKTGVFAKKSFEKVVKVVMVTMVKITQHSRLFGH